MVRSRGVTASRAIACVLLAALTFSACTPPAAARPTPTRTSPERSLSEREAPAPSTVTASVAASATPTMASATATLPRISPTPTNEESRATPAVPTATSDPPSASPTGGTVAGTTPATPTRTSVVSTPSAVATAPRAAQPTAKPTAGAPRVTATPATGSGSPPRVPVLMYHYVRNNPEPTDRIGYGLSIEPVLFRAHVAFLAERGFTSMTVRDATRALTRGEGLPSRPIALTFDDGYADFFSEAWPILRERGMTATSYVIVDLMDRPRYLSRVQVRLLSEAGVEIGSHTFTHPDLTSLTGVRLRREVAESRLALAEIVGREVESFCYPAGQNNEATREAVRAAGYRSAVTTVHGYASAASDLAALPRVRVYGGMGVASLASLVGETPPDPAIWSAFLADRPAP